MRRSLVLLPLLVWLLAGCASKPVQLSQVQEGHWRAKALIKDHEQSRSYIVNMNLNAKRQVVARMDVTTTLGMGVASLVVDNQEVRYILLDSKKYYYGSPQPGIMRPILSVPLDPRWLHNILFDIPIQGGDWACSNDAQGWLANCTSANLGLKITWSGRSGDRKTVLIEHSKASVQINVTSFKPKVEDRKNLFTLEAPEGFQKLHVH